MLIAAGALPKTDASDLLNVVSLGVSFLALLVSVFAAALGTQPQDCRDPDRCKSTRTQLTILLAALVPFAIASIGLAGWLADVVCDRRTRQTRRDHRVDRADRVLWRSRSRSSMHGDRGGSATTSLDQAEGRTATRPRSQPTR